MFSGSIAALVTPFNEDLSIDFDAFDALIEWHIEEGTDALVICGSTGESPTLHPQERCTIIQRAIDVSQHRIPIIAGTGTYDTRETVKLTEDSKRFGADGCLVIVPYYNRPSPQGCFAHFKAVAEAGLPTLVYHHPVRTGVRFSAATLLDILAIPGVIGFKDASGDLEFVTEVMTRFSTLLFTSDDTLLFPYLSLGGAGSISIIANLLPKEWAQLVRTKDFEMMKKLFPIAKAMVIETNPQPIKYALSLIGKCTSRMRLPLLSPSEESQKLIIAAMVNSGMFSEELNCSESFVETRGDG